MLNGTSYVVTAADYGQPASGCIQLLLQLDRSQNREAVPAQGHRLTWVFDQILIKSDTVVFKSASPARLRPKNASIHRTGTAVTISMDAFLDFGPSELSYAQTIARRGERLSDAAARWLATEIFEGRRTEGSSIQGEADLAKAIGVSKVAWREGIHFLVGKGMLQHQPNRGVEVAARAHWNLLDADILEWMFDACPNRTIVRALFELRGICETGAVRAAALHRDPQQLDCLHRCLLQMEHFGVRSPPGQQADFMFHRTIFAATGNEALSNLYRAVKASIKWTTHTKLAAPVGPDPLPEHAAVYTAIHDRDALGASAAMQALLERALADLSFTDLDKRAP